MDTDALRSEVAKRFNVLLSKDDPIFVAVALNELVLEQYLARIQAITNDARDDAAAAVAHQVGVAKAAASTLVTATAGYVTGQVKQEVAAVLEQAAQHGKLTVVAAARYSSMAMWAAAAAFVFAGTALGMTLAVLLKH